MLFDLDIINVDCDSYFVTNRVQFVNLNDVKSEYLPMSLRNFGLFLCCNKVYITLHCVTCQTDKSEKFLNELTLESCNSFYTFEGDILSLRMKHVLCYHKALEKCASGMDLIDS